MGYSIHRGLRDIKIATWTSENSYGTAYDVFGARNMSVELVVESDSLLGDDVEIDQYSKVIAVNVSFENGAVDMTMFEMMTGGTLTSTAGYEDLMVGQDDSVPYIAMAGRVVGSDGQNDLHIFVPKMKLSGNFQLQAQNGQYVLPTADFRGIDEGTINGLYRYRKFNAPTTLTIPLATAVD